MSKNKNGEVSISIAEPIFDTYQGEFPGLGLPIKLVRFQGCNLAGNCPIDCDTKYSWKLKSDLTIKVKDIKPRSKHQSLLITGGEPFMQNDALCALVDYWTDNYNSKIIIETNGTLIDERTLRHLHILGGDDIYISISPKTLESFTNIFNIDIPIDTFRRHISFKAVVGSQKFPTSNWEALLFKAAKNGHPIYLMPEGTTQEELIKNLKYVEKVGRVLEDNYKLSPRMHIFLGIK